MGLWMKRRAWIGLAVAFAFAPAAAFAQDGLVIFAAASLKNALDEMAYVEKKDLIQKDTRINLLGNKIVLIAPRDSNVTVDVKQGFDLAKALNGGKLAMANV